MEPVQLDFIVKGDIENELAKVRLAIKGVGDESYSSYTRLFESSNKAYNSLSKQNQAIAISLQENIRRLRQNEAAQQALFEKYKKGQVASTDYARAQSRLAVQQSDLKKRAAELNRQIEQEIKINALASGSMAQKQARLEAMRTEYTNMSAKWRENEKVGGQLLKRIKELDAEINNHTRSMKQSKAETGDVVDVMEQLPGPIGSSVSQVRQLTNAGKAFMTSGVGMFVSMLAGLFLSLKIAIEGSEAATARLEGKKSFFLSLFNTQKKMITEAWASVYNSMTGDDEAARKNMYRFHQLNTGMIRNAQGKDDAAVKQVEVNKLTERNGELVIANTTAVEQYRTQLMDVNKTLQERIGIGQNIISLEKESMDLKLSPLGQNYDLFRDGNQELFNDLSQEQAKSLELADQYFKTMTDGGELTLTQQKEMINTVNDITSSMDRWSGDEKKQFRSYFTDALNATKEYYNRTREVATNVSNIIKEEQNKAEKDAQITKLDLLQEEVAARKTQYDLLEAYEINMGKEAASGAFEPLKKEGDSYIGFLNNRIAALQSKETRTADDDVALGYLFKEREAATPKEVFDPAPFKAEIEAKQELYKTDLDALRAYLQDQKRLIENDESKAGKQKNMIVDAALKKVEQDRQAHLDNLLAKYQTYATQMTSLENTYNLDMQRLSKAYDEAKTNEEKQRIDEAKELRTEGYKASLAALEAENEGFSKVLFGDLRKVSKETLKNALVEAKEFIAKWVEQCGELSPEMEKLLQDIQNGIDNAEEGMKSDIPGDIRDVAYALQDCAYAASQFDEDLGAVVQTAADVAYGVADIAQGIANFSTNPIAGASQILSGIAGIIGGIGTRLKENKKIREEYLQTLVETYSKELEYNALLRERLRIQQQLDESSLQYYNRMGTELDKQKASIAKEYEEVWSKLMGENYISDTKYKHGTWFRKAKTWNEYSSLAGKSYEDIESLYTQDKLDGAAKTLFERLQQLKEEGEDVVDMMGQLQYEMQQAFTGTTATAIRDSIIQGFMDGKRSAADFADSFEEMMRKAMLQSIAIKYIEEPLMKWYDDFASMSEEGLTQEKIDQLREQYNKIVDGAASELDKLEQITGITGSASSQQAKAGAFNAMSQDTGDELNGRFAAMQLNMSTIVVKIDNIIDIMYICSDRLASIDENTRYCRKLEAIDNNIAKILRDGIKVK